jgi:excinuclease ABC subunit C
MASLPQSEGRKTRLADQRKKLPDGPGVYLFRDAKGKVIYVGKAKSIKKRVASHFSNPVTRGAFQMVDAIDHVDFILVSSETEALLVEQNFIKQYQPQFNIRLRDDKSYPYIAISMDEKFPRVYFTREKHRKTRLYFGPYSSAKRTRSTLETLGKVFQYRSCNGPEPAVARARRAWTSTSSAAGRRAWTTASTASSTWSRSTASARSCRGATARSSAISRRG